MASGWIKFFIKDIVGNVMSGRGGPLSKRQREALRSLAEEKKEKKAAKAAAKAAAEEYERLREIADAETARLAAEAEVVRSARARAHADALASDEARRLKMEEEERDRVKAGIHVAILNAIIAVLEEESGGRYNSVPSVITSRSARNSNRFLIALKKIRKDILHDPVRAERFITKVTNHILSNRRLGSVASTEISRAFIRELLAGERGKEMVRTVLRSRELKLPVNASGGKHRSVRHRKSRHRKTVRRS